MAKHGNNESLRNCSETDDRVLRCKHGKNNPRFNARNRQGLHESRNAGVSNVEERCGEVDLKRAAWSSPKHAKGPVDSHATHALGFHSYAYPHGGSRDGRRPFRQCADAVDGRLRNKARTRKVVSLRNTILLSLAMIAVILVVAAGVAVWRYVDKLDYALSADPEQSAATASVLAPTVAGEPFYMLLLGSDSREGSGTSSSPAMQGDQQRSDVIILLRVDAPSRQVTMISIPRDTPHRLDDGTLVKINEVYNIEGAVGSIKAVSELTGVPVSHYAEVHFSEFQSIIDTLGGVTINVPVEMSYKDALTGEKVTLQPGEQTLNGQQAQIFVRSRKVYDADQDAHRQDNVRMLLNAIIDELLNQPPQRIPSLVLELAEYAETDVRSSDLLALGFAFMQGEGSLTVYSGTGPTDGEINEESGGLWLCYEDPEGWASLMAVVEAGGDPKRA